jgi:hypothetical protein
MPAGEISQREIVRISPPAIGAGGEMGGLAIAAEVLSPRASLRPDVISTVRYHRLGGVPRRCHS